jgi:hypothetical protein
MNPLNQNDPNETICFTFETFCFKNETKNETKYETEESNDEFGENFSENNDIFENNDNNDNFNETFSENNDNNDNNVNFDETISEKNKISKILECKLCNFKCTKNNLFIKHCLSKKHKAIESGKKQNFICQCSQSFYSKTSLWRHTKICSLLIEEVEDVEEKEESVKSAVSENPHVSMSNELVIQLLKQNNDLQLMLVEQSNKMFELAKEAKYITNNSNNNSNNQFNLNVFLNDKCKDAINMDEFVDSLQLKLKDLEETARLGYSDGISRIFINGLNELDIYKRPIHCSDLKRETIYIKDQDTWGKDDTEKSKLTKAVRAIGRKNMKQIFEWQELNPEYNDSSSKQSDRYHKMICNVMNGSTKEEQESNLNKIIRNITKEVVIDKVKK